MFFFSGPEDEGVEIDSALPMTDLHAGLLHVLADGAVDWPSTLAKARQLVAAGVRRVVVMAEGVSSEELTHRHQQLKQLLAKHHIPLEAVTAPILSFDATLFERVSEMRCQRSGILSHYVLIRPPRFAALPMREVVERLLQLQLRPVLISPEAQSGFQQSPDKLASLVRAGCLVQISAASLVDPTGAVQTLCRRWIKQRMVHFVSSGDEMGDPADTLSLQSAESLVRRENGQRWATALFRTNPGDLFTGAPIGEATSRRWGHRALQGVTSLWSRPPGVGWPVSDAQQHGWA